MKLIWFQIFLGMALIEELRPVQLLWPDISMRSRLQTGHWCSDEYWLLPFVLEQYFIPLILFSKSNSVVWYPAGCRVKICFFITWHLRTSSVNPFNNNCMWSLHQPTAWEDLWSCHKIETFKQIKIYINIFFLIIPCSRLNLKILRANQV